MDNSSNTKEEAYAMFDEFDALIRKQALDSTLVLVDFENCYHDVTILGKWKQASVDHVKYVKKTASVGVTGSFRMAMAAYRFFVRFRGHEIDKILHDFDSVEAAKDWLLE